MRVLRYVALVAGRLAYEVGSDIAALVLVPWRALSRWLYGGPR